jgi:hypothetical protein
MSTSSWCPLLRFSVRNPLALSLLKQCVKGTRITVRFGLRHFGRCRNPHRTVIRVPLTHCFNTLLILPQPQPPAGGCPYFTLHFRSSNLTTYHGIGFKSIYEIFCVHYLFFIGRVYVFYVGHLDKSSLYETLFHYNVLSKHHHHEINI